MAEPTVKPSLDSITTIREDGSRYFIHQADVRGWFTRFRRLSGILLIALYAALPWTEIGGNPAVFLDAAHGKFHLFGFTFVTEDFWLVFFLITGLGFALFYVTALVGRVWCGWACPQTVFLEVVFRRIERWIEGDAVARRKLDAAPWTVGKALKRGGKLFLFGIISLAIAHLFISYFISLPRLYGMMQASPLANFTIFAFVFALAAILWFNFAWFREQFCIVLCPYGRLQSALIDNDSVVIGYDQGRGEPRGKPSDPAAGDCIDCFRCVQVCPTGIDIRQGLQMECIQCAACIDACDEVMARLKRKRGLVRYDSTSGLEGKRTRWVRPRTILYTFLMILGAAALSLALTSLRPARLTVLRMTGAPYYVADGVVRNQFMVRVVNKRHEPVRFDLKVDAGSRSIAVSGNEEPIQTEALGEQMRTLVVSVPASSFEGAFPLRVEAVPEWGSVDLVREVQFLGPAQKQAAP